MRHGWSMRIVPLCVTILMLALAGTSGAVPPHRVFPTQQIPADVLPTGVIATDFDEDGATDLVIAGTTSGVVLRFGVGDGSFGPSQELMWVGHDAIACGDIDDDGLTDIVSAEHATLRLLPLVNVGGGAFVPFTAIELGERPAEIIVVDLDEDTALDLVTVNPETGTVSVAISLGGGRFATPVTYPAGLNPVDVAVGDVNEDGPLDIIVADAAGNAVLLLPGLGAGVFGAPEVLGPASTPRSIAVADVDDDGVPEVAVANAGANNVALLDGGDGVDAFDGGNTAPVGLAPFDVTLADVDGDGHVDLLASNFAGASISILRGSADGSFAPAETIDTVLLPKRIVPAQLDGGGHVDLVVLGTRGVVTHFSDGEGGFPSALRIETPGCARSIAVTDEDADERPEVLLTADLGGGAHAVRRAEMIAPGLFGVVSDYRVGHTPIDIRVAAIDDHPLADLAVLNLLTRDVSILHARPHRFDLAQKVILDDIPRSLATGDLDGDGRVDLAAAMADGTARLAMNDGSGFYGPVNPISFPSFYGLALVDLDHDGAAELIGTDTPSLVVARNDGTGGFAAPDAFPTGFATTHAVLLAAVQDVDGDGDHDAIVVQSRQLAVMRGYGDGTFDLPVTQTLDCAPKVVTVIDVDGDGRDDVIAGCSESRAIVVMLGSEEGTFGAPRQFHVPTDPGSYGHDAWSLDSADLDRDGDVDLLIAACGGNTLLAIENATIKLAAEDLDASGAVGWGDLVALLENWGPCVFGPCITDLDGNGAVGFGDLVLILNAWTGPE